MPNIRQHINLFFAKRAIKVHRLNIGDLAKRIENGAFFSFARFGDGEWSAILGKAGANCDGHEYTPALREALIKCLLEKKSYLYGIQPFALKNLGREIARFIKYNHLEIPWYYASVFHDANVAGALAPFIKAIHKRRCVLIGPVHLRNMDKAVVDISNFIEIPLTNCFNAYNATMSRIINDAARHPATVYLFSASMAANVMIHHLYDKFGMANWFLDIGSLWDVYVGVESRGVYKSNDWTEIIKKNLA